MGFNIILKQRSQDHRINEIGRDIWISSTPAPWLRTGLDRPQGSGPLYKYLLTVPNHLECIWKLLQDYLLQHLPQVRGDAKNPLVPIILPLAPLEDRSDIFFFPLLRKPLPVAVAFVVASW